MPRNDSKPIWVVVKVESGIPTLVEAYRDKRTAKVRERSLRRDTNPDYDEVGAFQVRIGMQSPD